MTNRPIFPFSRVLRFQSFGDRGGLINGQKSQRESGVEQNDFWVPSDFSDVRGNWPSEGHFEGLSQIWLGVLFHVWEVIISESDSVHDTGIDKLEDQKPSCGLSVK